MAKKRLIPLRRNEYIGKDKKIHKNNNKDKEIRYKIRKALKKEGYTEEEISKINLNELVNRVKRDIQPKENDIYFSID